MRCLMVGFDGLDLTPDLREALTALDPGGIILFRRNLDTPERLIVLLQEIRGLLPGPRLVALDQEGGRVSRLEPWIGPTPAAARLACAGEESIRSVARATAAALASLGFNFDLAPVVDLSDDLQGDAIGDRAFGSDPSTVTQLAGAFLDGLQRAGVAGCLKHFPGLGGTTVDSHGDRPTVLRSRSELEERDLVPYAALGSRAAAVLVGHAAYPALDGVPDRPASLSPEIVGGLLRGRLGFGGLVATDDLEMGALRGWTEDSAEACAAVDAGCDLLLCCRDLGRALRSKEKLIARGARDSTFAARLADSAARIARVALRWPGRAGDRAAWDSARDDLGEACARV